jgi:S-adenosylmethionine synthetase
MTEILIAETVREPTAARRFELVERKGLGHPDSICDAVMEEAARDLIQSYLDTFDAVQHFNLDKALLAAGQSSPRFGGGSIVEPMRFIFGDRAVYEYEGKKVPVDEILEAAARRWFGRHLKNVDPNRHLLVQSAVRPGSPELTGIFKTSEPGANDTSVAVGFAPLTETETLTLEAENFLNGPAFKGRFPESGEDVKVLGIRRDKQLDLTVAMAFVDRFVPDEHAYFRRKAEMAEVLHDHIASRMQDLDDVCIHLNMLDRQGAGPSGVYLTVTGTSAESADSGQVGRGNQLSGLFSSTRPTSNEAVAGKNPVAHVGKVYNVLARRMAQKLAELEPIREATVYLASQIGRPIAEPQLVAVELALESRLDVPDVTAQVKQIVNAVLPEAANFARNWALGARS